MSLALATLQERGEAAIQAARDVLTAADRARDLFMALEHDLDAASADLLPPLKNGLASEATWLAMCLAGDDAGIPMVDRELLTREVRTFERGLEITLREGTVQVCRDCGKTFPYDPDRDRCEACSPGPVDVRGGAFLHA